MGTVTYLMYEYTRVRHFSPLTPPICTSCARCENQAYDLAGTEDAKQCFCGKQNKMGTSWGPPVKDQASSSDCSAPCR